MKRGLALTGGGARAAYQAGVLKAVAEVWAKPQCPFQIITGISAGAINGTFLATHANDFQGAVGRLWELWSELRPYQVYRTDPFRMASIASIWLANLSIGALKRGHRVNYMLDASPLRTLLSRHIDCEQVGRNLAAGHFSALAVSATNVFSGTAISFCMTQDRFEPWERSQRIGREAKITVPHVLASSAIPLFFGPVSLENSYFVDGCVRLTTPLSPAIHLGADKILAVGIRHPRSPNMAATLAEQQAHRQPEPADIGGLLLNALFMDSLEGDLERVARINNTIRQTGYEGLREIPTISFLPSQDLGQQAAELFDTFPLPMRHLLRGLGASQAKGWDLLSYLAFDKDYTCRLLEMGYQDALKQRTDIEGFLA